MDNIKEKIITKSLELFSNIGVKVVTMDMISEELGMSKKTLYEHFSSKEELIKQTFNESFSASVVELENKIKNYQNTIHQKLLILGNIENLFLIKKDRISLQLEKFYPEIYSEIINTQKQYIRTLLKNNILLGIEEGLYRTKINKKLTVEYYYLVEQIIVNKNSSTDINLSEPMVKNYFFELLIRSIATKKGIRELEKLI